MDHVKDGLRYTRGPLLTFIVVMGSVIYSFWNIHRIEVGIIRNEFLNRDAETKTCELVRDYENTQIAQEQTMASADLAFSQKWAQRKDVDLAADWMKIYGAQVEAIANNKQFVIGACRFHFADPLTGEVR